MFNFGKVESNFTILIVLQLLFFNKKKLALFERVIKIPHSFRKTVVTRIKSIEYLNSFLSSTLLKNMHND